MAAFTGTGGTDVADSTTDTLTGFTGGTLAELQDGIGDTLDGAGGADTIVAGSGNDIITGGLGADTLAGGDGDDTFIVVFNEAFAPGESIDGGLGLDTLSLNESPLFADFTAGTLTSIEVLIGSSLSDQLAFTAAQFAGFTSFDMGASPDHLIIVTSANFTFVAPVIFAGVEQITINDDNGGHTIIGSIQNDTINGNGGSDILDGGGGNDSIIGGEGDDLIFGRAGADYQDGGAGSDTYTFPDGSLDVVSGETINDTGSTGIDVLRLTASTNLTPATISGIEQLSMSGHTTVTFNASQVQGGLAVVTFLEARNQQIIINNATTFDGSSWTFPVVGGASWNPSEDTIIINGTAGADTISGTIQLDIIDGGTGNDTLLGGAGNNTLVGGSGDDTFFVSNSGDIVVEEIGGGTDTLNISVDYSSLGNSEIEIINITAGGGFVNFRGNNVSQTISGAGANNYIWGEGGNDVLFGGAGDDSLEGGTGNDALDGGDGSDTAVFSGAWVNYTISLAGSTYTITDTRSGSPDGTDTVTNLENFQFSNGTFTAGQILNDAPVALADGGFVGENKIADFFVLGNDTDADAGLGDTLTVTSITAPTVTSTNSVVNGIDVSSALLIVGDHVNFNPGTLFDALKAGQSALVALTYTIKDAAGLTATAPLNITVVGANDAPIIDLNGEGEAGTGVTFNYTENQAATAIAPFALISDVDSANFDGGILNVGFAAAGATGDQLSIQNQGTGTGQIGVGAGNVTYGGTVIGTVSGGAPNGGNLVIFFNSAATPAAVQALAQNILFVNTSENPSTLSRTLQFLLTDGSGGTTSSNATINVTPVNDAPVLTIQGNVDIVTTNFSGSNVSVLLGNGSGGFAASPVATPGGTLDAAPAIADLNGDGALDVLSSNYGSNNVSVLLGDGRGNFAASTANLGGGLNPSHLALGDLNADGKQDIVTANDGSNNISVLLGTGTGAFTASTATIGAGFRPVSVAIGDIDGDGKLDVATANQGSNNISVLLGDGAGGFTASTIEIGSPSFSVALGDVNHDGNLDIVAANHTANTVSVLLGNGTGAFSSGTTGIGGGVSPMSVALGDLNGDGNLDVVTANLITNDVSVLLGDGLGGFAQSTTGIGGGVAPWFAALQDLNGDGRLDIVTANRNSNNVSVLLGDGAGGFIASTAGVAGFDPISIALGNVNNAQVVNEDTSLVFDGANGNVITLSDVDSGSGEESVTLSVAHGALTLATTAGLTVTGNGSGSVSLSGTVSAINAALDGLSYLPIGNYIGTDTLTITANDNGNTGIGGALTSAKLVPIVVNPVNDAPVAISLTPSPGLVSENQSDVFVGTLSATDPDQASGHTFQIPSGSGIFEIRAGNQLWVQAGVSIDYESLPSAFAELAITVTDASGDTFAGQVPITFVNVNDAPVAISPDIGVVAEDSVTLVNLFEVAPFTDPLTIFDVFVGTDVDSLLGPGSFSFSDVLIDGITILAEDAGLSYDSVAGIFTIDTTVAVYQGLNFGSEAVVTYTQTITDGEFSASGTVTLHVAGADEAPTANPDIAPYGGTDSVMFVAFTPVSGFEAWRLGNDGSLVQVTNSGLEGVPNTPNPIQIGNRIYFNLLDPATGNHQIYDMTTDHGRGQIVTHLNEADGGIAITDWTEFNGALYFRAVAADPASSFHAGIFRYDGSGTPIQITDEANGIDPQGFYAPRDLNGTLIFGGFTPAGDIEVYEVGANDTTATQLTDSNIAVSSYPNAETVIFNGAAYFVVADQTTGDSQVYRLTPEGALDPVTTGNALLGGTVVDQFFIANDGLYFKTPNYIHPEDATQNGGLFRIEPDGTTVTRITDDGNPNDPQGFFVPGIINGILYWGATNLDGDGATWHVDPGTGSLVEQPSNNLGISGNAGFTLNGLGFFNGNAAFDGSGDGQVYSFNPGTGLDERLTNLNEGAGGIVVKAFFEVGGELYFHAVERVPGSAFSAGIFKLDAVPSAGVGAARITDESIPGTPSGFFFGFDSGAVPPYQETGVITVDVLANDTGRDSGSSADNFVLQDVSVAGVQGPGGVTLGPGLASIAGNKLVFDPGSDFVGLALGQTATVVINYTMADAQGATSSSTATITLNGVNGAPSDISLDNTIIEENSTGGTLVGTLSGTDPDSGDTLSFSLIDNAGGRFEIVNGNEIVVVDGAVLDADAAANSFSVSVRATDSQGLTLDESFTINLANINEAPALDFVTMITPSIAEGTAVGTGIQIAFVHVDNNDSLGNNIPSLDGDDASLFAIRNVGHYGGELWYVGPLPDFETQSSYFVTLNFDDPDVGTAPDVFVPFTISVADVNEVPTEVSLDNTTIGENSAAGTLVGILSGTDPDTGDLLSFSLIGNAAGRFEIVNGKEVVLAAGADLDFESTSSHDIIVRATDSGGLTRDEMLTIEVLNVDEVPTQILVSGGAVDENSPAGTLVATLDAVDPEGPDTFSFAFVDDAGGLFEIVGNEIRVAAGAVLDFEAQTSYPVTVEVTDSSGLSFTQTIDITVNNVSGVTIIGTNAANTVNATTTVAGQPLPTDEEDTIFGRGGNDNLSGLGGNDQIFGEAGNDRLIGGAGTDTLTGGLNNDTYVLSGPEDVLNDTIVENLSEGTDTVEVDQSYTLGANLENLLLTGADNLDGTGNELVNRLTGNAGDNVLDGGLGADTLVGGAGDDIYIAESASDVITEGASAGTDEIRTQLATYSLAGFGNVENLTYIGSGSFTGTGNAQANVITGGTGNDTLSGAGGADSLIGGLGDDIYIVDNVGDQVIELANEGNADTVRSSISYTLGTDLENVVLTGAAALNATGNAGINSLTGNSGANILDGGVGADVLSGLGGNDTYIIDNAGDTIVEAASAGTDSVQTALSAFSLATIANLEKLTFTGSGNFVGTGNSLANTITGGSGDDMLDGGTGADRLIGGTGNDAYIVDSTSDAITEGANAGTDTVFASVAYTLGANFDNLTLTGTAVTGAGNGLANEIIGTANANTLSGGAGNDTLIGGAGNDTLTGGTGFDMFVFGPGFGADRVQDFDFSPAGGGQDLLDISAFEITSATFVSRVGFADLGADILVTIDGDVNQTIRLVGAQQVSNITEADFVL